ncbi:selenocysteine-specific translation elongation factor [Sulfitobacter sp.]|uniref:selenocysteine-specific translation elongation factor n=1 Tax=Sulfitobacter sp. TaxID=1903071 RepID=UPI0030017DA0
MKTCCVVVIGHVDHGKTALVRVITGIATDRLPEEKERGLSILPGYANKSFPDGTIDFIDAPGHEDFIPAMVSGASGADAALIVVSAIEGIGAQTFEHLEIASLLGISRGIIAITKADLLDPSNRSERLDELRKAFAETAFAAAPMVLCSALSGEGMGDLNAALNKLLDETFDRRSLEHSTLAIDRAFSLTGKGTIVTGTLSGGDLKIEDELTIQPLGRVVSVRGLHSRGTVRDIVHAAERVAVNLRGIAVSDVPRGAVLCRKDVGATSECIDVELHLLPSAGKPLKHMDEVRVLFGTSSEVARVRLFGGGALDPGQIGLAQLRFKNQVFGLLGQRAVIRKLSPAHTIGGAIFLDPQAAPTRAGNKMRVALLQAVMNGTTEAIATALILAQGGIARRDDIVRLSRNSKDVLLGDEFVAIDRKNMALRSDLDVCKVRITDAITAYHKTYPLQAMAPRSVFASRTVSPLLLAHAELLLHQNGVLRQQGNLIALTSHDPEAMLTDKQRQQIDTIEQAYRDAALASAQPLLDQFEPDLTTFLSEIGRLITLPNVALKQNLVFHADTLADAAQTLCDAFPPPASFTTSQARTALGTSRKIIVPVLEYFDRAGVTLRNGGARQMSGAILVPPPARPC